MKTELREKAVRLRLENHYGYSSIAKLLPVAKSTLSRWLKDYPLSKERIYALQMANLKNNELKIERYRNTMRERREIKSREIYTKYIKVFSKLSDENFFVAGLTLYLAEGSKTDHGKIVFTNTDPRTVKLFLRWMVKFLKISKSDIKAELHLYENMDIDEEKKFWENQLGFSTTQFYKTQIRKFQKSSFLYKE